MTQLPPETARGYDEPPSIQFSVFLANRIGQLQELLILLAEEEIELLGISVVDSTDWAVIRVVLSDPDKAREIFRRRHMPFTESAVTLVELSGQDALSAICGYLVRAELSVHFAYPLIIHRNENPVMVIHVDDPLLATQTLLRHGIRVLGEEDLFDCP